MARKPNYQFERMERERIKANKAADKARAKREQQEQDRAQSDTTQSGAATGQAPAADDDS
jgi:hypothetical protein